MVSNNYSASRTHVCHVTILYPVDGGERVVIFDRFRGVLPVVVSEGTHFLIPWVQKPIYFSVRSQPRRVPVVTGSKGHMILHQFITSL